MRATAISWGRPQPTSIDKVRGTGAGEPCRGKTPWKTSRLLGTLERLLTGVRDLWLHAGRSFWSQGRATTSSSVKLRPKYRVVFGEQVENAGEQVMKMPNDVFYFIYRTSRRPSFHFDMGFHPNQNSCFGRVSSMRTTNPRRTNERLALAKEKQKTCPRIS